MTRIRSTYLAVVAVLLSPMAANAVIIEFDLTFDGTSISVDAGSATPAGTSFIPGDSFNLELRAAGGDFWSVDSAYSDGLPLTFAVTPNESRTGNALAQFFLDGTLVFTINELGVVQNSAHIGAQFWSLSAGLLFDTVSLNYDLLTSTGDTTIVLAADIFTFNHFFRDDRISYQVAAVPEPGTLALLGIGLLGMGAARRRRKV